MMKIPKYIGDFFHYSASIAYDPDAQTLPGAVVGYTFRIRPINRYQQRETFYNILKRVVAWAERCGAEAAIIKQYHPHLFEYPNCRPAEDHYIVTITDPACLLLERAGIIDTTRRA